MRLSDLQKRVLAKKILVPPILDLFPNAAAAYSLRKLRTAYTGNCIEVRRSSDNALQNIGFVNNFLDTASLLSFVGAGDGFVRTWYDQSGNNNNVFNTLNNSHPTIVTNNSIVVNSQSINSLDFISGGDKLLSFTLGNTFTNKDYGIVFCIYENTLSSRRDITAFSTDSVSFSRFAINDNIQTSNRESLVSRRLNGDSLTFLTSTSNFITSTRLITGLVNWGNAQSLLKRNGQTVNSSTSHGTNGFTSNNDSAKNNSVSQLSSGIGRVFTTTPVQYITEVIFYNTNQDGNISLIENNINSFYNIY
jgi:hypothetical protein